MLLNSPIAKRISAREYQYRVSDFDWKYCHRKRPALKAKKNVVVDEKSWLIIVAPSVIKKVGNRLNRAITVKKIMKIIVTM